MKKKVLSIILSVAMTAGVLTACGESASTTSADTTTQSAGAAEQTQTSAEAQ